MAGASVIDFTDEDRGIWTETFTGERFYPFDPHPSQVHLLDIAHHLAFQCRFAGACDPWYSVAEHSIRVMWRVRERLIAAGLSSGEGADKFEAIALWAALFHDAAEAYMGDVIRPIKRASFLRPIVKQVEARIDEAIRVRFGMPETPEEIRELVKLADNESLATERRDLMVRGSRNMWAWLPTPLPGRIKSARPEEIEVRFIDDAVNLAGVLGFDPLEGK